MTNMKAMKVKKTEYGYECSMSVGTRTKTIEIERNEDVPVGYYGRYFVKRGSIQRGFDSLKSSKAFVENHLTGLLHPHDC